MLKKTSLPLLLALIASTSLLSSQQIDTSMLHEMRWRSIGPFRGGRTRAVAGVPSQPNVFYVGAVNGGVWKTDDSGRTWQPIFDHEPTGSIGAIAVALSDPNTVYVASGEGLHRPDLSVGDGIYKSNDAGKTWTHLGLREGQQIPTLAVDPRDANKIFAAVAGHPYGPNPERGIYRSLDGGKTFEKVLFKDENVGGNDVKIDPSDSNIVYATLWEAREGPWENGAWNGTGGGIYKSSDGGATFQQLAGGLPNGIVQAYISISTSNPKRLFASVATKEKVELYRSDDAGQTWATVTTDSRPKTRIGGGDLPVPAIDPKNPDTIYMTCIVTWRSEDGGKTWTGIRGAPGGDDYQNIWINPENPNIVLLVSDQGALVTVNRGETWSSWYNQPTAQMYHVNADNNFPYRLCSGQQESGSACVMSRGNDGEITFRDWHPISAEEYGYVVPDPLDPDIVYGGKLTRYDRRTTQAQNIMPNPLRFGDFRVLRTEPIVFSPKDPHLMYFASNTLWATRDAGQTWKQVSSDLTRKTFEIPATVGIFKSEQSAQPKQRGVIYAVAISPVDDKRIWAGTDDGLIWLTTEGGAHWNDVTPKQLIPWQKVSILEASHSDPQTAYAAINTLRLDDLRPHIYRTHDSGKTWTEIVNGIPDNENVNAVREDTQRKGLLFAGTERAVYVSFDDGDHWQSLRLNMPATSIRDLTIKDDDLAVGTHGRGFWILDDITALRQLSDTALAGEAYLFAPELSYRVRWDTNSDTPLPPDEPAGDNPPDGAILNYYIKTSPSSPVILEVTDSSGKLIRRYSSADPVAPIPPDLDIPTYWVRPSQQLSSEAGFHRFFWDMHYTPVAGIEAEYPIAAVYRNTAPQPTSPWIMPGKYNVVLTVNGKKYTQSLTIKMDPRVKTSGQSLQQQFDLSQQMYKDMQSLQPVIENAQHLQKQLELMHQQRTKPGEAETVEAFEKNLNALLGGQQRFGRPQPGTLSGQRGQTMELFNLLQDADVAPSAPTQQAVTTVHGQLAPLLAKWTDMEQKDLPQFKQKLGITDLPKVAPETTPSPSHSVDKDED